MSCAEPSQLNLLVRSATDPLFCSAEARALARRAGFAAPRAAALAIAVAELASNIVRHAKEGSVFLRLHQDPPEATMIEVVAADRGPGIADLALAQQDGYSRGRFNAAALERGEGLPPSLGCGLGAVRRLTDECEIESVPGRGTTVTVRLYLRGRTG
ncbi:MAG: ATP-binding protein [Myxococcales bacterium]